jgi:hypothetical protein
VAYINKGILHTRLKGLQGETHLFVFMINTFFFFVCLPFVSLYPIYTDIQPTVFVVAILIIFLLAYGNRLFFDKTDLFFFFFAILSFVYFTNIEGEFDIRKRIGMLFAFFVYYLTKRFHRCLKFKVFYWAVVVNFVCGIFHFIAPAPFASTAGHFIRTVKIYSYSGPRGISGLTTEPGFLGAMCVFFLAMLVYFNKRESIHKRDVYTIVFMAVTLIILTKSGTGYVLLTMFFAYWIADRIKEKKAFIWLILGIGLVYLLFQPNSYLGGRGYEILNIIYKKPSSVLLDTSIVMRLSNVYIAIWNLIKHPFGSGIGTYSLVASDALELSYVKTLLINAGYPLYSENVSAFSQYIVEMGLFFIIFIFYVFYIGGKSLYTIFLRTLSFMYILVSFSILFPPTWVMLAIASNFLDARNSKKSIKNVQFFKRLRNAKI